MQILPAWFRWVTTPLKKEPYLKFKKWEMVNKPWEFPNISQWEILTIFSYFLALFFIILFHFCVTYVLCVFSLFFCFCFDSVVVLNHRSPPFYSFFYFLFSTFLSKFSQSVLNLYAYSYFNLFDLNNVIMKSIL